MSSKFGLAALKQHKEIIPLVAIMTLAVTGVASFSIYSLLTKTDVTLNKGKGPRWQYIDVNQPQKLFTIDQKYGEDPEKTSLKKEVDMAYMK